MFRANLASSLEPSANVTEHMSNYIREHFADLLGEHLNLLEEEGGLDKLASLMAEGKIGRNL